MMNRRSMLKGMAACVGATMGSSMFPGISHAAANIATNLTAAKGIPKRIIFFLQNQGFDPLTAIPKGLEESCPLSGVELAEPCRALEPYKDKMHIITGLHGTHTSPSHSAYFGALGGYRGGIGVPPAAMTIDAKLSSLLPETITVTPGP